MATRIIGYTLAVSAVFLWSLNYVYAKMLLNLTPMQISFIRWFLAMIFFLPFTLKSLWQYRQLLWQNMEYLVVMGLSGLALVNICVYYAGHTANAVDMSLIATLGPVLIVIFNSVINHKMLSFRTLIGVVLAIIGVIVLILHGDFENLRNFDFVSGDLWMLGTAVMFAAYSLYQRKITAQLPSLTVLSASIIVATIFCAPDFLLQLQTEGFPELTTKEIVILLIIGCLNSGFAYLWWNMAIQKIGVVHTGVIYYLLPVFGCAAAYVVLGEEIYSSQIYGAFLVLLGIILVSSQPKKPLLSFKK